MRISGGDAVSVGRRCGIAITNDIREMLTRDGSAAWLARVCPLRPSQTTQTLYNKKTNVTDKFVYAGRL